MSDYTKATSFTPKDSLPTGDPNKKIKGSEFDTEFDALETAIATKANKISGAVANNIVSMDANGDIQDSGETKATIVSSATPPGVMMMYGASTAPTGWLLCNGAAVSRSTYADLYAIIGTTYGNGNGSTTFNVPDLKGRFPLGYGAGSGLTSRSLNDQGGEEEHTLTEAEMPSHSHDVKTTHSGEETASALGGENLLGYTDANISDTPIASGTDAIVSAGSDSAHNNMPPYTVVNFIIKT